MVTVPQQISKRAIAFNFVDSVNSTGQLILLNEIMIMLGGNFTSSSDSETEINEKGGKKRLIC